MRRIGAIILGTAFLLTATSGCGTMGNVTGHEACLLDIFPERPIVPFGGVGNDLRWMARGPGAIVPAAIDLPLSCVGDIITLPWTTYQWLNVPQPPANPTDD